MLRPQEKESARAEPADFQIRTLWIGGSLRTLLTGDAGTMRPPARHRSVSTNSETGRRLLTEEHIVRDMRCAVHAGDSEVFPAGSNEEAGFKSHPPAPLRARRSTRHARHLRRHRLDDLARGCRWQGGRGERKRGLRTKAVHNNGVTAKVRFLDRGAFRYLVSLKFIHPKVPGHTFFPNLSKVVLLRRSESRSVDPECP